MYTTRNLFYLKISNEVVLPLYIYLDQQHVHWMSDFVLQQVLRDLKPLIGPKIALEGDDLLHLGTKNPKATVDVVSGEGYQFAFFFRKLEQHAVLIKSRNFKIVPKSNSAVPNNLVESQLEGTGTAQVNRSKQHASKRGTKRARPADSDDNDGEDVEMVDGSLSNRPRPSRRKIRKTYNTIEESEGSASGPEEDAAYIPDGSNQEDNVTERPPVRIKDEETEIQLPLSSASDTFPINVDEEEKPKMEMKLHYKGHHIPGRYLCVIVEPDPPLAPESAPRAESVLPPEVRFRPTPAIPQLRNPGDISASSRAGSVRLRSETPLFLPEHDDEDEGGIREESPILTRARQLPPVPRFGDSLRGHSVRTAEENTGGLLAFSQALTSVFHEDRGDDSDEDYLRGDADEDQRVLE